MPADEISDTPLPETSTSVAAPETPPTGVPELTEEEIKQAEQELAELETLRREKAEWDKFKQQQGQQQQSGLDPNSLGQALANAIGPLIPKPPEPKKLYETEKWLESHETLLEGIKQLLTDHRSQWEKEHFSPLQQKLGVVEQLIPRLYARAAENPNFSKIETKAKEIQTRWPHIPYLTAYEMAADQFSNTQQQASQQLNDPRTKGVPGHLSTPDTRPTSDSSPEYSGPADFGEIMKWIRAKGINP